MLEIFLVLRRNTWQVWTRPHSRWLAQWREKLDIASDTTSTLVCVSRTANGKSVSLEWSCDLISESLGVVDALLGAKEQEVSLGRVVVMLQTPHIRKPQSLIMVSTGKS